MQRAWAELDPAALIHNFNQVRQTSQAKIMAVIKANAYGHGMAFAAKALEQHVDAFAVATLEEAISLREYCDDIPITLLSGFYDPAQLTAILSRRIRPVIFNFSQIEWLQAAVVVPPEVWLKIDTGMGRLGIEPGRVDEALASLQSMACDVALMSHFASADTPENEQNEAQHRCFEQASRAYKLVKSFANSAAILSRPEDHFDLVRPGIMLYGSSPFATRSAANLALQPVMSLYARLIDIKHLKAGDSMGYGAHWVADKDSTVGIVSMGYGDGYPRVISQQAQLAIDGTRYPVIGRVSMDSMAVLLNRKNTHQIGTRVELWGQTISVDEVAVWANTIGYELLCKVGQRITSVELIPAGSSTLAPANSI